MPHRHANLHGHQQDAPVGQLRRVLSLTHSKEHVSQAREWGQERGWKLSTRIGYDDADRLLTYPHTHTPSPREPSASESLRAHTLHDDKTPIDDEWHPLQPSRHEERLGDIRGIEHAYLQAPHIALSLDLIDIILLRVRNGNPDARTVGRGRFRTDEFPFTAGVDLPGPQDHVTASR